MKKLIFIFFGIFLLALPTHARAEDMPTKANFIKVIQSNKVVAAAIADAKAFSGAKSCDYQFSEFASPKGFEVGKVVKFNVEITCSSASEDIESSAVIRVEGQWTIDDGDIQEIKNLSLFFAG